MPDVSDLLVFMIDFIPFGFETLPQFVDFSFCQYVPTYCNLYTSGSWPCCRVFSILYSSARVCLIDFRYSGLLPKSFFFFQSMGVPYFFAVDNIHSTALATTKFLSDLSPCTGRSVTLGTWGFLYAQSYEKFRTSLAECYLGVDYGFPLSLYAFSYNSWVNVCAESSHIPKSETGPFRCEPIAQP